MTLSASNPPEIHATGPVPLSPFEDLLCRLHDAFEGDGMCAVVARVRGRVEESPLRAALRRLQLRHPKLRARLTLSKSGRRQFETAADPRPIPLDIKDFGEGPIPWQTEAWRALCLKMDLAAGPLARMLVLRSAPLGLCDLVFVAPHAVVDGASVYRVVDDLLGFYGEAERGGPSGPVVSLPLVSAPRANLRGNWLQRLALLARMAGQFGAHGRGNWITLPTAPQAAPGSFMDRHVIPAAETSALVRRCYEEGTTLLGAHFAAAVCGLAEVVEEERTLRIQYRIPVDIRSALAGPTGPVTDQDLGCFIGGYLRMAVIERPPLFWELARRVRKDLKTYAAAGGPEMIYNLLKFVRVSSFRKRLKRDTLVVNCIGFAKVRDRYGSLGLEECTALAKNEFLGPSLSVEGVAINGRLCVNVGAGGVPVEFWKRFSDAVARQIRAATGQPATGT